MAVKIHAEKCSECVEKEVNEIGKKLDSRKKGRKKPGRRQRKSETSRSRHNPLNKDFHLATPFLRTWNKIPRD